MRHPVLSTLVLALSTLAVCGCALLGGVENLGSSGTAADGSAGPPKTTLAPGDEGYVDAGPWAGPLHQKYAGQVVFSSAPIANDAADDRSVVTTYTLGAPLYARYWSKDAAHNLKPCRGNSHAALRADVNGEHAGKRATQIQSIGSYEIARPNERGMASLTDELAVPLRKASTWTVDQTRASDGERVIRAWSTGIVPRLAPGDNTVRFLITLDCGTSTDEDPIFAEGTLQVLVPPGSKKEYLATYGLQLGLSPHPDNAKLAPEIVAVVDRSSDWDHQVILGARVVAPEWVPVRHKLTGIVTHHVVSAVVVARPDKETNLESCQLFYMNVERDAEGGPLRLGGVSPFIPFPCVNAPQ
jgi:hypothetical protein